MSMYVLVTGGAGFVGANVVAALLEAGFDVRILDNFSTGQRDYLPKDVKIIRGDILDKSDVETAVSNIDAIVHLAAQTGVIGSIEDPYHDCQLNIIGTLNLLEACRIHNIKKFVFASSNAPLGKQPPPATEDKAPLPISPYGASKLAGEGYCLAYHGSWGVNTVVLRFANLYGPFSIHKNSVVAQFLKDIVEHGEITIDGDGEQTRDFIYVRDLCDVIIKALKSDIGGEIFQIATGKETSIQELAQMIQHTISSPISIKQGPRRQGDIRKNYSAISKVKRELNWEPQVSLEEGLRATYSWFTAWQQSH